MSEIEDFIADVKRRGWEAEPMDKALAIARRSPAEAALLARRIVEELPKGGTFQNAALTYVALDDWPELVAHAIAALRRNRKNRAAESVFEFASLQCVQSLHPHLAELFELAPNEGSTYETYPWRGADRSLAEPLCSLVSKR